jgi:hypothetical protein
MPRPTRIVLILLTSLMLFEGLSLVRRVSRGETDFSIFYRTGRLLADGVGADLYPRLDTSGFPISLSPAGLALLQPISALSPTAAGTVWALVNLALVAVSLAALRRALRRTNSPGLIAAFPYAAMVYLVLAAGCVQVGQFSVLFVACWMLFLVAYQEERYGWAGFFLAVPAAIKVYPALLLAVPLLSARSIRSALRDTVSFSAGLVASAILLPALVYGTLIWALDAAFLRHVIVNLAQVDFMQSLRTFANQSLDAAMLRYFTDDLEFHARFVYVPHLSFGRDEVLWVANAIRVAIVAVTAAAAWQWRRIAHTSPAHQLLTAAGLWASALYVMLPETKSRYAVYAFLAFLPLLEISNPFGESTRARQLAWPVLLGGCVMLVAGILPDFLQIWGVSFVGSLFLWIGNVGLIGVMSFARGRSGHRVERLTSVLGRSTAGSPSPTLIGLQRARARETP